MKLSGRERSGFTPVRRFAISPEVDRSLDVCFYRWCNLDSGNFEMRLQHLDEVV